MNGVTTALLSRTRT